MKMSLCTRKRSKKTWLKSSIAEICPVEKGARGFVATSAYNLLTKLSKSGNKRKAFDKVNHSLLTHKLHRYGVQGKVFEWIRAFLKDRQQRVVVDGVRSDEITVKSRVPQGSVIGPALFLTYINDLPELLSNKARLFADDTVAYRLAANSDQGADLQSDLDRLESWERSWDMEFHPGKCVVLRVTRKRKGVEKTYSLHNQTLTTVTQTKYSGITFTNDLFGRHTYKKCVQRRTRLLDS